ncbi:hypothetical protein DL98DRAFT_563967 [Cadophora sp. DSE1049]|nr:hypothetical protein DL98DRAFT_563967 [Cadophora sp. DSE1049]
MATPEQLLSRPNWTSKTYPPPSKATEVAGTAQMASDSIDEASSSGSSTGSPQVNNTSPPLPAGEGEPRYLPVMPPSNQPHGTTPSTSTSFPADAQRDSSTPAQPVLPPAKSSSVQSELSTMGTDFKGKTAVPGKSTSPNTSSLAKSNVKPVIVGIYGISAAGKFYLINQLKEILGEEHYTFYDGSGKIDTVTPGGLSAFKKLTGKFGAIAGHFMFWKEKEEDRIKEKVDIVWTKGDSETFTYMLYLDVPTDIVLKQCRDDDKRNRPILPEKTCSEHGILFSVLAHNEQLPGTTASLLRDFREHTENLNLSRAENVLDEIIGKDNAKLETMLVLDADRTLCAVDTGEMFWTELGYTNDPLKKLFSGPMRYTHNAFRQASLLYEEATDDAKFTSTCQAVASKVKMHTESLRLLRRMEHYSHIGAVVVTCGLRRVWEMVLDAAGLSNTIKVIGGGRIDNGYVVTAEVKAALVKRLRDKHNMQVWAFGDSPLDLPMLKEADEAIVVIGEAGKRSKTMDKELENAITKEGLAARQVLLPSYATHHLDTAKLPIFDIRDPGAVNSIFPRREPLTVLHASTPAAQLLQTPMRHAENSGVALQAIHKKVRWFLATNSSTEAVGMEEYPIPHVQGGSTTGHRLLHERQTTIVALMRGGEPMAKGVHKAFSLAMFVHANNPSDLKPHHLENQKTILLVDSVINNGTTIVEFVKRIKKLGSDVKIVVVTGVAQKKSVAEDGPLARVGREGLTVALRLSENKYTGKGGTDTGNRLFNTTRFD